jgi:hypothetical protein
VIFHVVAIHYTRYFSANFILLKAYPRVRFIYYLLLLTNFPFHFVQLAHDCLCAPDFMFCISLDVTF